jgi:hypothetical protein
MTQKIGTLQFDLMESRGSLYLRVESLMNGSAIEVRTTPYEVDLLIHLLQTKKALTPPVHRPFEIQL